MYVFKHYDNDRDGYISQAEFRQISGNFPFIDPFGAIDLDRCLSLLFRDGQISREELRTYFVKANNDSVDFRLGFKHNFHETTFLTPTTCGHCGRLLWGLIRQGWKCKDCGLAVHCDCKANAVAECRRRSSSIVEWISPRSDGSRNRPFSMSKFVTSNLFRFGFFLDQRITEKLHIIMDRMISFCSIEGVRK
ncbi:unnamed protein product [Strongylus vulgaris]|uniref:Phorbol-ester/DAG-type domain-containing protein n=1 Tax=Strongylus vulgaris TaxID=40348 RepID=A0A3P7K6M3_STRVU|nr:unnamed protein product [Strongylus vulgaris]